MKGKKMVRHIKIVKRRSIAQMVQVKREKSLAELMEENDRLVEQIDGQLNSILAEIKIINTIMRGRIEDSEIEKKAKA